MTDSILDSAIDKLLEPYAERKLFCIQLKTLLLNQYKHKINWDATQEITGKNSNARLDADQTISLALQIYEELLPTLGEFVGVQPMDHDPYAVHRIQVERFTPEPVDGKTASHKLNVRMTKFPVMSRSQNMSSAIPVETEEQALLKSHGLDVDVEMIQALASECAHEEIQIVLNTLKNLAKPSKGKGEPDHIAIIDPTSIPVLINRAANTIAQNTRRGAGNWVLVGPAVLVALQSCISSTFARTSDATEDPIPKGHIKHVGTLSETIRVYVDPYMSSENGEKELVLIGYKGSSETDTGYIFSPWVAAVENYRKHPVTEEEVHGLFTRHGHIDWAMPGEYGDSKNYYESFTLDLSEMKFPFDE